MFIVILCPQCIKDTFASLYMYYISGVKKGGEQKTHFLVLYMRCIVYNKDNMQAAGMPIV